jgi:hypothetical protein
MIVYETETSTVLADALVRAVVALGRAGDPEQASRIAARAHADIRRSDPQTAQKLNNVLHGLARMPGMPERATGPQAHGAGGQIPDPETADPNKPDEGEQDE